MGLGKMPGNQGSGANVKEWPGAFVIRFQDFMKKSKRSSILNL
jgi:hypothetical protein